MLIDRFCSFAPLTHSSLTPHYVRMCLKCHLGAYGNSERILPELVGFTDADFAKINSTSLSHFTIAATGYNGIEARNAAMGIIARFLVQVRTNPEVFVGFVLDPLQPLEYYTAIYENLQQIVPGTYPKTQDELVHTLMRVWNIPMPVDESV